MLKNLCVCANIKYFNIFVIYKTHMFKKLIIPKYQSTQSLEQVSNYLDTLEKINIDHSPWDYNLEGKVSFATSYDPDTVYIKFFVSEKDVVATYINPNDPVYKDSCVEFFISFDGEENYYNFEFNSKGTCLAQYGKSKTQRDFLPVNLIKEIKTISTFRNINDNGFVEWELVVAIPKEVFSYDNISNFSDKKAQVNFYKCGDDLPQPHYLSWNLIISEEPNFHLPEFFGEATFQN